MSEVKNGSGETKVVDSKDLEVLITKSKEEEFVPTDTEHQASPLAERILRDYLAGEVDDYEVLAKQIILDQIPPEETAVIDALEGATSTVKRLAGLLEIMHREVVAQRERQITNSEFMEKFKPNMLRLTKIIKDVIW